MAFDFPGTPTEGQLFAPTGGPLYKYSNGVWTIPSTPPVMSISDTAPVSPIPGQLWWRSSDGASFLWFDDGTSKQWTQFNISTTLRPSFIQQQVITATGAITLHVDTKAFQVEIVGGGGGGGGATGPATGGLQVGGGGGGGGYVSKWCIRQTGQTQTVSIGAAGGAGANGGASGGTGGATLYSDNVGTSLAAQPGGGGSNGGGSTGASVAPCADGGSASGGDLNIAGGGATPGFGVGTAGLGASGYAGGHSGGGGGSHYGEGGKPQICYSNVASGAAGQNARGYGGGGGGGLAWGGGSVVQGGVGAIGVCVITEYR